MKKQKKLIKRYDKRMSKSIHRMIVLDKFCRIRYDIRVKKGD